VVALAALTERDAFLHTLGTESLVRAENLCRIFGTGVDRVTAVQNVSLTLSRCQFCALAGPSGSGKSTLLQLLGALDIPTSGKVWIRGQLLANFSEAQLSELRLREIGFVFQGFNLSPVLSAWENVEFPLLFRSELDVRERRSRVGRALYNVGLADKSHRRPHQLSGGEKQRVALARALAGQPSLLLADEPTANLDRDSGTAVVYLMKQLTREHGASCIFATHDPELMGMADRVIEIRHGVIAGEPEEPDPLAKERLP